jgi:hypothetical protein
VLANAGISLMFEAIKPLGLLLARLPVGPEHPGLTAGANFQLAYRASFLLPHRRSAWIRFCERLEEIADAAAGMPADGEGGKVLDRVAVGLREIAAPMAAHIERV